MKEGKLISLTILMFLLVITLVSADYNYSPMNFEPNSNTTHTFEANYNGSIEVVLPVGFLVLSGSPNGTNNVSFTFQSPNVTEEDFYVGTIEVDNVTIETFYLLSIDDSKIVDTKLELGHGDFNYLDYNADIGDDNNLLFTLVRVWGIGSDIWNEPATNVRFNCSFPKVLPRTVDSKYETEYLSSEILAKGELIRLEGISLFRVFVLSQEIEQEVDTDYNVTCTDLTYDFTHTNIKAEIPGVSLNVRSTNPMIISMENKTGYVSYTILNNETYDTQNLEFLWSVGTHTIREEKNSLLAGESVSYNIQTNESGSIDFSTRFVPEWMFHSRTPKVYTQTSFDFYDVAEQYTQSQYYVNHTILTESLFETQPMNYGITIIDTPPNSNTFQVTYSFFSDNGNGEMVDQITREITGVVGDKQITFSSADMSPSSYEEDFAVYGMVSVLDLNGEWYDFENEYLGSITVGQLGGGAPSAGFYDVIVSSVYDQYGDNEKISADITIKNTGDIPDEDTILTYYLVNSQGEKFGETKEQFLEMPVGITTLRKSIQLPVGATPGEWKFNVKYETIVQPMVEVYDSFEVITGRSIFNTLGYRSSEIVGGGYNLVIIFILLVVLLTITVVYRQRIKNGKK